MADSQTLYIVDDSTETESSSQQTNVEQMSEQFMYMQQLLPSRSQGINKKCQVLDNLASILPYATLRTRQMPRLPIEVHANAITSHLRLNSKLIQDDPRSHKLRMETLKAMPQCLTVKRSVKSKLQASIAQVPRARSVSYWKWLKYRSSYTFSKMHVVIRDSAPTLKLWYSTIKSIEGQCGSGIATYFKFLRWLICLNIICCVLSVTFIILPQALEQTHVPSNIAVWDFLTGSGFFTDTIMYYGFYTNNTMEGVYGMVYSVPSAYFMTLLSCYILTLIVLSIKVATSYRKCFIEIRGKVQNMYSNKIFCGWDFSISSSKAATLHSASIYRELEELLAEAEQEADPRFCERFKAIVIQVLVTIIILAMICGTAVLLWVLLDKHEMDLSDATSIMVVPMVVTVIMQIFPAIISWLALLEKYKSTRTKLYVTVIRIHAMAATVIGTLVTFWLINTTSDCWQTKLGAEIYRLILLDFIFATLGACLFDIVCSVLYNMGWTWIGKAEFDIARSTLNLIYNQTLFWLGFYFSPVLSLIILAKTVVIFYVKKHGLLKYCGPPSRPWRAAQTETLFLALAFLGMICVVMALGYAITSIQSNVCGPFRAHENAWDFVIGSILSLKRDSTMWRIVSELTSPAMGTAILTGMGIGVYCLRAKVEASKELLQILREMLILQSRDKEFLMKSITKISSELHIFGHDVTCSPGKDSTERHARFDTSSQASNESSDQVRMRNVPSTSHCQDDCV